jgi:hypothetical protein
VMGIALLLARLGRRRDPARVAAQGF